MKEAGTHLTENVNADDEGMKVHTIYDALAK
jgi:hypothetical protein